MVSYNHNIGYRSSFVCINVSLLLFNMTNIGAFPAGSMLSPHSALGKGYLHDLISILHILLIPLFLCFLIPLVPLVAILFVVIYFLLVSEAIPFCRAFFPYSYHHVSHEVKLDAFIERLRPVPETTDFHLLTQSLLDCCHSTLL